MFTRFNYDQSRTIKKLEESTGPGKYNLNVPGNGISPHFYADPHIRLEKWGANLTSNSMNINNELSGITRKLNRDCIQENYHKKNDITATLPAYPTISNVVGESRTETPAWELREKSNNRWDFVHQDPQKMVAMQFQNNVSTRILTKDHFLKDNCNNNNFNV